MAYTLPVTESQKAIIRAERLSLSAVQVARKHGITRQRVYQVVKEAPNTKMLAEEQKAEKVVEIRVSADMVRFAKKSLLRLNDPKLQKAIRNARGSYIEIAKRFGTTFHAVQRIHVENGGRGRVGRPRKNPDLTRN